MIDPNDPAQHPAEAGFSRTWETVKFVGGKALKWAAYGALAAGALYLLGGGFILTPVLGAIGGIFSAITGGSAIFGAAGTMAATLIPALLTGGVIGAVLGSVKGLGGAGEAVEEARQDRIADYEANEARIQRNQALNMSRGQSPAPGSGLMAGLGLGGRGAGLGR